MVAIYLPSTDEVKTLTAQLYDVETRPQVVASTLSKLGAERLLDIKTLQKVASMSTVSGFIEQKDALKELAAPYLKKACEKEGRKELLSEAAELASVKVIKPSKELASQYVSPYIAKVEEKRAEIVASKRYERAMAALQHAREHPYEMASDLRSTAIDLLKYEKLASYRDYIQSEEFLADTRRLLQVDLPAIASDATSRGIDSVKQKATMLASEVEAKRAQVTAAVGRGYAAVKSIEMEDLKERAKTLVSELQKELSEGVAHVKTEGFSLADAVARIKKVVSVFDAIVVSPILMSAFGPKALEAKPDSAAPADAADETWRVVDADAAGQPTRGDAGELPDDAGAETTAAEAPLD